MRNVKGNKKRTGQSSIGHMWTSSPERKMREAVGEERTGIDDIDVLLLEELDELVDAEGVAKGHAEVLLIGARNQTERR